jgi:hypothetical protein
LDTAKDFPGRPPICVNAPQLASLLTQGGVPENFSPPRSATEAGMAQRRAKQHGFTRTAVAWAFPIKPSSNDAGRKGAGVRLLFSVIGG